MKDLFTKALQKIQAAKPVSTSLSDNQAYPQLCLKASHDYRHFNTFRRHPVYSQILEHVSENQGSDYLQIISRDDDILAAIDRFKDNDTHGGPRVCDYPRIGSISPSTLRYIKVLMDLKSHFQTLDGLDICEIGVGYGGQCRIINAYFMPEKYCLVDIQPALSLARRFLDHFPLHSTLTYKTMNELRHRSHDLVISNDAFTQLPRAVQDVYLRKVILNAKRGYITCREIASEEFDAYTSAELTAMIPGAKILAEDPLRHPKNGIIVWGAAS